MTGREYGAAPEVVGRFELDWHEYVHYLYLPVVMAGESGSPRLRLPERLRFLEPLVYEVMERERLVGSLGEDCYVYVTARRGYASPGNPLNRPGWHADGFGSDDVNYVWSDRWPTRFAVMTFEDVSNDHVRSAEQFTEQIERRERLAHEHGWVSSIRTYPDRTLLRLDPSVIHATPIIPEPGGERSFLKVSVSPDRYNLRGNSHNYLFDYDWRMWSRDEVRNDPAYAGGDAGPQDES